MDLEPGMWEMVLGIDRDRDDRAEKTTREETVELERTGIELRFDPKVSTVVELKLRSQSPVLPRDRPDLGIGRDDVKVQGNRVTVTVHNFGIGGRASE